MTEKKREKAVDALRKSEMDKSIILENLSELIVYRNRDMETIWASRSTADWHGITPEEIIGRVCYKARYGRDKPCEGCYVIEAMETGISKELETRSPDGRYWHVVVNPTIDDSGEIIGAIEVSQDITERKKAEEELKLRAEMLDQARDGIILNDFDGNFIYANEMALKEREYKREEFLKLNVRDVRTEPDARRDKERRQEIKKKGYLHSEYNIRRKDGVLVPMDAMATVIKYGGTEYILSVTRDITERKKAEAEKAELERKAQVASRLGSVGEMASGIAHEINNPLTGVVGFAHLLIGREDLPEDVREQLKVIHEGGQRVSNIIQGLLSFARQSKPKRTYLDINEVIEGTIRLRQYR
ncbi:MAG: PAS domain S-box protein, partial [Thermoplasmata archaeon]|nr:PAS domain S-box protein [Thermoplasmata archaeon]